MATGVPAQPLEGGRDRDAELSRSHAGGPLEQTRRAVAVRQLVDHRIDTHSRLGVHQKIGSDDGEQRTASELTRGQGAGDVEGRQTPETSHS